MLSSVPVETTDATGTLDARAGVGLAGRAGAEEGLLVAAVLGRAGPKTRAAVSAPAVVEGDGSAGAEGAAADATRGAAEAVRAASAGSATKATAVAATATGTGAEPAAASEDDRSMTGARGGIADARGGGAAAAEAKDVVTAERVGAAAGAAVAPAIGAARAKEAATVGAVAPEEAVRPCLAEDGCAGPRAGCTTEAAPVEAVARATRAARVLRAFAASSQSRALCPTT